MHRGRPFQIRIDRHVIAGPHAGQVRGHRVGQRSRAGQRLSIRIVGKETNGAVREHG